MRQLIFVLLFFSISVSAQNNLPFSIHGTLKGGADKELVLYEVPYSRKGTQSQTYVCKINGEGNFTLNGKLNYAGEYLLYVRGKDDLLRLYVDTMPIKIYGHADSVNLAELKGGRDTELTRIYNKGSGAINNKYTNQIKSGYSKITGVSIDSIKSVTDAKIYKLMDSIAPGARSKILDDANDYLYTALKEFNNDFLLNHPGNYAVLKAISDLIYMDEIYKTRVTAPLDKSNLNRLIKGLPVILNENPYYKKVAGKVFSINNWLAGVNFPEITLKNERDQKVNTTQLLSDTKYLLVDFWASWCGPCIEESKEILKVYRAFNRSDFEVMGITIDQERKAWLKALQQEQYPWPQGYGFRDPVVDNFGLTTIPANFLVNKEGKIVAVNIKHEALEVFLKEHLKAK